MFKINKVQAHCDIPCKVYDPSVIQYSTLSIVRFIDLINEEMINSYSTPGSILNLLNFAHKNDLNLKQIDLKDFIKKIIVEKKYKKDQFVRDLIFSLIEIYFRNNVSVENIKLLTLQNYFLKKIKNTKIFNLDNEALLMEFEDKVLNG